MGLKSVQVLRNRVTPIHMVVRACSNTSKAEVKTFTTQQQGPSDSMEYRLQFKQTEKLVSPWHEIPLYAGDGLFHFVCEIPKETTAKMEVSPMEVANPIKQDIKKGKLRHYPYNINWNYGMMPQTWEDPAIMHPELMQKGDKDPLDVVEIGSVAKRCGGVYKVKPLGVFAMIDDGELDWKVVAICADDPKASLVNDVEDVEKHFPGELTKIYEWFRDYKIPDGKPPNLFGYDNRAMNKEFALKVIEETHEHYVKLKSGARPNKEGMSLI